MPFERKLKADRILLCCIGLIAIVLLSKAWPKEGNPITGNAVGVASLLPRGSGSSGIPLQAVYAVTPSFSHTLQGNILKEFDDIKMTAKEIIGKCSEAANPAACVNEYSAKEIKGYKWQVGGCSQDSLELYFQFTDAFKSCIAQALPLCYCSLFDYSSIPSTAKINIIQKGGETEITLYDDTQLIKTMRVPNRLISLNDDSHEAAFLDKAVAITSNMAGNAEYKYINLNGNNLYLARDSEGNVGFLSSFERTLSHTMACGSPESKLIVLDSECELSFALAGLVKQRAEERKGVVAMTQAIFNDIAFQRREALGALPRADLLVELRQIGGLRSESGKMYFLYAADDESRILAAALQEKAKALFPEIECELREESPLLGDSPKVSGKPQVAVLYSIYDITQKEGMEELFASAIASALPIPSAAEPEKGAFTFCVQSPRQVAEKSGRSYRFALLMEPLPPSLDPIVSPHEHPEYPQGSGLAWPVAGEITTCYGDSEHVSGSSEAGHSAIDFGYRGDADIRAIESGVVTQICTDPNNYWSLEERPCIGRGPCHGFGTYVVINHGSYTTQYNHLSQVNVAVSQEVEQGDIIGQMGSTGCSTGNHLDFRIYDENHQPMNPFCLLAWEYSGRSASDSSCSAC